nr:MAG TPA: Gurmarin, sweet, taste, knottin, GPCR.45A [Caudoviricetes sp.]
MGTGRNVPTASWGSVTGYPTAKGITCRPYYIDCSLKNHESRTNRVA